MNLQLLSNLYSPWYQNVLFLLAHFNGFVKMNNHDACPIGSCADDYHLACLKY